MRRSAVGSRHRQAAAMCGAALLLAWIALCLGSDHRVWGRADAEQQPQAQPQAPGRLIRIPLPITGSVDMQIKRAVQRAMSEAGDAERPVLVLEFSGKQARAGQHSDFGRSLALARFLSSRDIGTAKTVAFLPKSISGHAVLVAMACEEIVMAPDATIGEAGIDEEAEEAIDPTVRAGYTEIANRRRTIPAAVALGMLDKNIEVLSVETELSRDYVLRSELDEFRKDHTVQSSNVLKRAGELGRMTGREARELGFVKYLADDPRSVAKVLSLAPTALDEDPSLGEEWRPLRVPVKGPITSQLVSRLQRMLEEQLRSGDFNFVCVWIDSPGGSLEDSMRLAQYLADLDSARVRTVAYIGREARGDAALVALACDQIVMNRDAVLGGPGEQVLSPEDVQVARQVIRDNLAKEKSRTWSLMTALVDPQLQVYRYTHRGNGLTEYFCPEEAREQPDADQWVQGDLITQAGEPLKLKGEVAEEYGLARYAVGNFDEFKQRYHLEHELALAEPTWADYLIDALAEPGVAWLLLLIGGAALYAELQAPGIGFGGFVAGLCFLLYFWSKFLDGTAGWLEVLLFTAGVGCVLLEVFVLPGTAVFGFGGGLLVISSLVLASQTFVLPHNQYQLDRVRDTLLSLAGAGVGVIVIAMIMRKYLPHAPLFSHMMLEPPSSAELEDLALRESVVDFRRLLGQHGVASTQLAPSGKARIAGELVDVIAEGDLISRGAEIVVVSAQGNRVVVRAVSDRA